jgi:hypothetical protein
MKRFIFANIIIMIINAPLIVAINLQLGIEKNLPLQIWISALGLVYWVPVGVLCISSLWKEYARDL